MTVDLETTSAYCFAFVAGVALHLLLFRHGELDLFTVQILWGFALLHASAFVFLITCWPEFASDPLVAASTTGALSVLLCMGVFTSMFVYRGFFHRLCRFPGPFLARISNFYVTFLSAKSLHLYESVQQLHKQYGDFVRLGPSELSINNADAILALHAHRSACTKGPWYNVLHPVVSLQMIRDKQEHIRRRRIWDRGFSAKALRDYEPRVTAYTDQLLAKFASSEGQPINVTEWFNFYSFDVMGDLAWGKSFGMLREGVSHYFMKSLHASMTTIGLFSHLPWLLPIFKATPILNAEHKRFWGWVNSQVTERRQITPDRPDIFSWILEDHDSKNASHQDELNLVGDAYLIAVAGSDTTAASLTCLFYQLAINEQVHQTLQKEVDEVFETQTAPDAASLGKLSYLNAVINETLRLHPPVPSGVQRVTPPQGLTIGSTFIPGDTIVQIPTHTIFRDERYFDSPEEFIPERWTYRSDLVKNTNVFIPFSYGHYSCIGKQLGLMEIRYVAAHLVRRYNVSLAPGQSAEAFLKGKRDTFTLALSPLQLVFSQRP